MHCKQGVDRTGAVIAAYRIDHDHWDTARALSEAKSEGMGNFQFPRQSFIRVFQPRAVEAKTTPEKAASASDAATVNSQSSASNR